MKYQGAQQARKDMKVPCEIIRVPEVSFPLAIYTIRAKTLVLTTDTSTDMQGGHFVFIDNPVGFHSAIFYACRKFLSGGGAEEGLSLPDGLISA